MSDLLNTVSAQNAVSNAYDQLTQPFQRLSTGSQLTTPTDNPAAYSIAQNLLLQLNGTQQAENNVATGMNVLQTESGGMSNALDILQTMSTLAVEGASGTLTQGDLNNINTEFQQLNAEVGNIAQNTTFNGTSLLNGSNSSINIQSGPGVGRQTSLPTGNITPKNIGLSGAGTQTQAQSEAAITSVANAMEGVLAQESAVGAAQNGLTSTAASLANSAESTASSLAQITDANIASEAGNLVADRIRLQASVYTLSAANQQKGLILNLLV